MMRWLMMTRWASGRSEMGEGVAAWQPKARVLRTMAGRGGWLMMTTHEMDDSAVQTPHVRPDAPAVNQ